MNPIPAASVANRNKALAKPNYQFEKRQRDLAKKKKQEEKRLKKLAEKSVAEGASADTAAAEPERSSPDPAAGSGKT